MKRLISVSLCMMIICTQMPTAYAVGTSASSAILMEAESGRILYEQNADEPRLIASITKLMTGLVALESGLELSSTVVVPREAVGAEGSSLYLKEGEEISLEALLYGMLMHSGNDAALAVAVGCMGSVEAFVAAMNEKAEALGMTHSHFENPNGLNAPEHYSSAHDMAILARACLENEQLATILATKNIQIGGRSLVNHNKLLWNYSGCIGMKTGYTEKAGRTLVSAAEREGMKLIAVTLNDPDDWKDHTNLLDWGFAQYSLVRIAEKGMVVGKIPVRGALCPFVEVEAGDGFCYPVSSSDSMRLSIHWSADYLDSPVQKGATVGSLEVFCGEKRIAQIPLVCSDSLPSVVCPGQGIAQRFHSLIS